MNIKKALVIAAHPDDEVLGCGGTMARLVKEGTEVSLCILGEGVTSRESSRDKRDQNALSALQANIKSAAQILGIPAVNTFQLPDNRFDSIPLLDVVKIIEAEISKFNPEVVFTQSIGDLNVDHSVTYRATLAAGRPLPGSSLRAIYSYEVLSSSEWSFGTINSQFRPNLFIDISSTLEQKIQAMAAYCGELREFPHPRSLPAIRAQAQLRGSTVGLAAAEAFCLVYERR